MYRERLVTNRLLLKVSLFYKLRKSKHCTRVMCPVWAGIAMTKHPRRPVQRLQFTAIMHATEFEPAARRCDKAGRGSSWFCSNSSPTLSKVPAVCLQLGHPPTEMDIRWWKISSAAHLGRVFICRKGCEGLAEESVLSMTLSRIWFSLKKYHLFCLPRFPIRLPCRNSTETVSLIAVTIAGQRCTLMFL